MPRWARAGLVAALLGGAPSTAHALATRRDPLEATLAAGSVVLPGEQRRGVLLAAAVPVHVAVSLAWAYVLGRTLPRRRPAAEGAAAGVAIAALDLGLIGRRNARLRALPLVPQVADHALFGTLVGAVLGRSR